MKIFQKFEINTRTPIIIPLNLRQSNKFYQIMISDYIFCEKKNLIYFIIFISICSSLFWDIKFNPNKRFYIIFDTCLIKLKCTIHISVISNSNGCLTEFFCSFHEAFRITECLLKSVVSMVVKMDEWHAGSIWKNRKLPKNTQKFAFWEKAC